jgi:hypothetical protein
MRSKLMATCDTTLRNSFISRNMVYPYAVYDQYTIGSFVVILGPLSKVSWASFDQKTIKG